MPDLTQIPNFHLKAIFAIHLTLITLSSLGHWIAGAYLFYNAVLIATLLWSIYKQESDEAVQMAILVNVLSILLDIIVLIVCFPDSSGVRERFAVAFAIIHLLARPVTTIVMGKILQQRSGTDIVFGRNSYEDIDRNAPISQPQQRSYDFGSAEQI